MSMGERSDIDRALKIFQEFGPNRAIPVQKRWRDAFPNVTIEQLAEWETLFRELEHFAYGLGEQVLNGDIGSREAAVLISNHFPQLSEEHVNHTLSQAVYFASK
jgi:hypothetical protein